MPRLTEREKTGLRERLYNATVTSVRSCTARLRIFRVRPDGGPVPWSPGQYLALGLGAWEPRADVASREIVPAGKERELVTGHYSFSHPILDRTGAALIRPGDLDEHEFYVAMPDYGDEDRSLRFTPRLFALREGDRLHAGEEAAGGYGAAAVGPEEDALFVATGTGEAPHNALVWRLLSRNHRGRIASVICTRLRSEQGYRETHERLEAHSAGYRYLPLVTGEPGEGCRRGRVQEYFGSGALERDLGWAPDPARAHVFLCGNPEMIGPPDRRAGRRLYPEPEGMIELLERRGFNADERSGERISIHYERFW